MYHHKIIWAFDPTEKTNGMLVNSALFLDRLSKDFNAQVEPVYVLSPSSFLLPPDYFLPPHLSNIADSIKLQIDTALQSLRLNVLPAKVLVVEDEAKNDAVHTLIDYGKSSHALFIFCATHGRTGLPRFWLGSFVENLLMYSHVPIFTFNPNIETNVDLKSVLFPTDLTESSKQVYLKFLPAAKTLHSQLILCHCFREFELASQIVPQGMNEATITAYRDELKKVRMDRIDRLEEWKKMALDVGIDCHIETAEGSSSLVESILDVAARRQIRLIALATHSGTFENFVTGGVARQLVRYASCPVWIVHQNPPTEYPRLKNAGPNLLGP